MPRLQLSIAITLLAFTLCFSAMDNAQDAAAQDGPNIPSIDYDGLMDLILQHKGRVVLVNFWATWCGPCIKEMPGLAALREEIPQERLAIINVSFDFSPQALKKFLAQKNAPFDNYIAGAELMDLLNIKAIPKMLIYDAEGFEVVNHAGYTPIEELRPKVQALLKDVPSKQ